MSVFSITIDDGEGCCDFECPQNDLSVVITGPTCSLSCQLASGPSWITTSVDFTGGFDLEWNGFFLYSFVNPSTGDAFSVYPDEECAEVPTETTAQLEINVFCNEPPNDDGKKLGFQLSLSATGGTSSVIVADLQTDPEDWFGIGEEVEVETPCGTFTILVTDPGP